jgi:hypothetical protein
MNESNDPRSFTKVVHIFSNFVIMIVTMRSRLIAFRSSGGRSCASDIAGASFSTFRPHPAFLFESVCIILSRTTRLTDDYIDFSTRKSRVY